MATEPRDRADVASLARELRDDSGTLAKRLSARTSEEIPEWAPARFGLLERAELLSRAAFEHCFGALAAGGRMPEAPPASDRELGRLSAQLGAPLHRALDTVRRGHAVAWEAWFELVERAEPDPARQQRLLEAGSRFFFEYSRRSAENVAESYNHEREALTRTGDHRRARLIHDLLAGDEVELDVEGYDLAGHHLGVVISGERRQEVARALADALGRRLLSIDVSPQTSWSWLGGLRPLSAEQRRGLAAFRPPEGAQLAIGVDAPDRAGFRQTHADALQAQRAGLAAGRPVTFFDDVALEALAGHDETAARRFVGRELRGIDGEDERSRRLRETLATYFRHGGNAAATAKSLGIHEQTVAQRLTAIEQRTGRAIVNRRAELETALRLRGVLGPTPS